MLSDTLNTNEIKDASGTEVEFEYKSGSDRSKTFQQIDGSPAQPHLITVSHSETGAALKLRRRSLARVDLTVISDVDSITPVTASAYKVVDIPLGALLTNAAAKKVLAELDSFCSTLGTSTLLYDGTGLGNHALLDGSL